MTAVRDLIAESVDAAIATVAPEDQFVWDTSVMFAPHPSGQLMLQQFLVLFGPSPVFGTGSLVSIAATDLRELADLDKALAAVRLLVEELRKLRAQLLTQSTGPLSVR